MPVDVYEGKTLFLSIPERAFNVLDAAQTELRGRTGCSVDTYATTVVSPDHARLWLQGLRGLLPPLDPDGASRCSCEALMKVLMDVTYAFATRLLADEGRRQTLATQS